MAGEIEKGLVDQEVAGRIEVAGKRHDLPGRIDRLGYGDEIVFGGRFANVGAGERAMKFREYRWSQSDVPVSGAAAQKVDQLSRAVAQQNAVRVDIPVLRQRLLQFARFSFGVMNDSLERALNRRENRG